MGLFVDVVIRCHACAKEVWAQSKIAMEEVGTYRIGDQFVRDDHMVADSVLLTKDGICECGARQALVIEGGYIKAVVAPEQATCEELPGAGLRRLKRG